MRDLRTLKLTSIYDYVKVYNTYSEDEADAIFDMANAFTWDKHRWNTRDSTYSREQNELEVHYVSGNVSEFIAKKGFEAAQKYLAEFPTFWITDACLPRLNRYTVNSNMELHVDHIHSLFDGNAKGIPILSIVHLFNDDFKGGDFVFNNEYKVDLKKGDILLFPSVFIYQHKVETITEGERLSCVQWAW